MAEIAASFSNIRRCMAPSFDRQNLTCIFQILNGIVNLNNDTVKDRNRHE